MQPCTLEQTRDLTDEDVSQCLTLYQDDEGSITQLGTRNCTSCWLRNFAARSAAFGITGSTVMPIRVNSVSAIGYWEGWTYLCSRSQ